MKEWQAFLWSWAFGSNLVRQHVTSVVAAAPGWPGQSDSSFGRGGWRRVGRWGASLGRRAGLSRVTSLSRRAGV